MEKENKQDAADKQRDKADLWKKMTDENAARAEREWKREEEAANRAARELQEKKKKRRKKIRIAVLLLVVIAAAGIFGGFRYRQYQEEKAAQEADVLALADGEELVYGKITKAVGNDIIVTVLEVKQDAASGDEEKDDTEADVSTAGEKPEQGSVPDGTPENMSGSGEGGIAEGMQDSADGSIPESTSGSPEDSMPAGMQDSGASDAPQGMGEQGGAAPDQNSQGGAPGAAASDMGEQNSADGQGVRSQETTNSQSGQPQGMASAQNALQYTETSQTKEYEVPVGTEVTTRLGATTSFSRLSVGNIVGIVVQSGTDNILRIKIVE